LEDIKTVGQRCRAPHRTPTDATRHTRSCLAVFAPDERTGICAQFLGTRTSAGLHAKRLPEKVASSLQKAHCAIFF
jgi:hypothetical protein